MAYLSNRTSVVIAVYLRRKVTFTAIFFVLLPDQFDAFNPKNISKSNNILYVSLHLLVNLKNVRVLARPMLFNIELRGQCEPLTFPPIQTPNEAPRSVKH